MADHTSTLSVRVETGQSLLELEKLKKHLQDVALAADSLGRGADTRVVSPTAGNDARNAAAGVSALQTAMDRLEESTKAQNKALDQQKRHQLSLEKAAKASHDRITAKILESQAAAAAAELEKNRTLAAARAANEASAISSHDRITAKLLASRAAEVAAEAEKNKQLAQVRATNESAAQAAHARRLASLRAAQAAEAAAERESNSRLDSVRAENEAAARASHARITANLVAQRAEQVAAEAQADRQRTEDLRRNLSAQAAAAQASHAARVAMLAEEQRARKVAQERITAGIAAARSEQIALEARKDRQRLEDLKRNLAEQEAAAQASHARRLSMIAAEQTARRAAQARAIAENTTAGRATYQRNLARLSEGFSLHNSQERLNVATERGTQSLRENSRAMRDAHGAARGLSGSLGMLWMTYGSIAPLAGGAIAGGIARSTFQVGKDLEYRLKFIEALGNQPVQLDDMMGAVKGSMKTPLEAAEALQALAQAGQTTNQALTSLLATMQLSTLGELGMQDAVYAITGSLAAFNLEAAEASRVGDVFAKAASMSNTTVAKITESMKQASSAAASYGVSMEETSAALVMMAKQNITGSLGGTAWRNMTKELYTPIARGARAMETLGLSAYDAEQKMRPLSEILIELQSKLVGMDAESRNRAMEAIFGERGARAIRPIMSDLKEYLRIIGELEGAQGFLAEASAKLLDTAEGAQNRMQSTLQQSFSNAFSQIDRQVASTILTLDSLFASSGFVTGVSLFTSSVASVIQGLAENSRVLASLAAGYAGFKALQLAFAAGQKASQSATDLFSGAVNRATGAVKAKQAAVTGLTGAITGLTGATQRAAGASTSAGAANATTARGFGVLIGRVASFAGWVGILISAYTVFTSLASTLNGVLSGHGDSLETVEGKFAKHLSNMRKVAEERNKFALATLEPTREAGDLHEEQGRSLAELDKKLQNLREQEKKLKGYYAELGIEPLDKPAARTSSDAVNWVLDIGRHDVRELDKDWAKLREEIDKTSDAIELGKKNLAEYANIRDIESAATAIERFNSQRSMVLANLQVMENTAFAARGDQKKFWEGIDLDTLRRQVEATKNMEDLQRLLPVIQKLQEMDERFLVAVDFETPEEPKTPRDRTSAASMLDSVLRGGIRSGLQTSADIIKANEKATRSLIDAQTELNKQYLTKDVLAGLEAREKAESYFNQLLDNRLGKIQELKDAMAAADAEGALDPKKRAQAEIALANLQHDISTINQAKAEAGARAQAEGARQYLEDNSIHANINKLFTEYQNAAMDTGGVIRNALETSFNRAGDALDEFVLTGKMSFRSFTVSVLQDLAVMARQMATNHLFGMVAQTLGGLIGGGITAAKGLNLNASMGSSANFTPSVSYTVNSSAQTFPVSGFAKGGAFEFGRVVANAKGNPYLNGVVSKPTLAPMALFGEAGAEAIMPLTRTSDGSLGVRALPSGFSEGGTYVNVETNVYVQSDGSNRSETNSNDSRMNQLGSEISRMVEGVIQRHLRQGGMIRTAIREA